MIEPHDVRSPMLPPIRYPLPTLVLLLALGLIAWRGEQMTRPLRSAWAERRQRAMEGPPVPSSNAPRVVAGPIVRKALLLHDDVAASARPGGPPAETIRLRMFVDVYDVWPLRGEPEAYRVGNRRPIGWVKRADLLPWDTRLVVRPPAKDAASADQKDQKARAGSPGRLSLPVVSWTSDSIDVATWEPDRPWQALAGRASLRVADLGTDDWGVWLSREELLGLLRRLGPGAREPAEVTRLRAILGRLSDDRPLTAADVAAARAALPAPAFAIRAAGAEPSSEALARVNEGWAPEAAWAGLSFEFLPLSALP